MNYFILIFFLYSRDAEGCNSIQEIVSLDLITAVCVVRLTFITAQHFQNWVVLSFQLAVEVRYHGLLAPLKELAVADLSDRINA
jgi:hypothetical protein